MSRIIVKNLPNKVNDEQIIAHFSKVGQVTDVKLKYKKNGEFRGYGFLGFESEEVAGEAAAHFQNTFFKQNKIITEICYDLDHKIKSRTEKKRLEDVESAFKLKYRFRDALKRKEAMTKENLRGLLQNPDFIQYLTLNQKGTADLVATLKDKYQKREAEEEKGKEEEEEEEKEAEEEKEEEESEGKKKKKKKKKKKEEEASEGKKKKDKKKKKKKVADQPVSDLEYLQSLMKTGDGESKQADEEEKKKKWESLPTLVIRTKEQLTTDLKRGRTLTKKGVKEFLRPVKARSLRIPRGLSFVAYVGFKTEKDLQKAMLKDKSFLDGVRVRLHRYEKRSWDGAPLEEGGEDGAPKWKEAEEALRRDAVPVAETGKLFVRNLWYSVTEEDLRDLFQKIGPLSDVTLPVSKVTRRPKGFAHVAYVFPEHAVRALNDLDGTSFKGRVLHVMPSLSKEGGEDTHEEGGSKNGFQEKRKAAQKKSASSWHNWNTLFLGTGAVIDLMTQNFATSKSKLFSSEGDQSVAVSLALGETQLVEETKRFLEAEGVALEAFAAPGGTAPLQRSPTVLLAKNLPAKTSARELRELFGRHGELGRVLMPPAGVTALIEYLDPSEARRGFKELAYSKFKYLPLYLEWAPVGVFEAGAEGAGPAKEKRKKKKKEEREGEEEEEEESEEKVKGKGSHIQEEEAPREPDPDTTLYVKNLNFQTEEEDIKKHFSRVGPVHSVLLCRRGGLSQGYGFVQFQGAAAAKKALTQLQESLLDGHRLVVKPSEKRLGSGGAAPPAALRRGPQGLPGAEPPTPKILVKNIPFQATPKEIRQLFKTFGELKVVRLPSKPGSEEHRGFGFVEFITMEDAKKALSALGSSTHLYGRRLVLEWAKEDESVEDLRKRTAEQFGAGDHPTKRKKVELPSPSNGQTGFEDS